MKKIYSVDGDVRMDFAARALTAAGHKVSLVKESLPSEQQVLLLPVRCTADGVHVSGTHVLLTEVKERAKQGIPVIGGGLPNALCGYDYMKNEAFLYDNARITAEGAVMLLGAGTSGTVFGMDVAVIGMGRIAECLCPLLRALGACVTVYARRPEALARARAMGAKTMLFSDVLPLCAAQHDAVCNTVPHVLYDKELLSSARCGTLLLELASAPGGFDMHAASAAGLTYIDGQGLPGKYAPRVAGELIAEYVIGILQREDKA